MKKVLVLLGLVLSFFLVSCADEPFAQNTSIGGISGNIEVVVDGGAKDIIIGASQVTQAVITLMGPTATNSQTWRVGSGNVFYFTAGVTGSYTIRVVETDTSNHTSTSSSTATFQGGYNYYVTVSLGGNITITIGSNGGTTSSATSSTASSAVSSTASSATSSAASSVSADIVKVYSERTAGIQVNMDPNWQIWPATGDSVVFNPISVGTFEGAEAIECGKGAQTWIGFVIQSVLTNSKYYDMTGFTNLNFALKASSGFPLTIQVGCGQAGTAYQKWFTVSLIADGAWHTYQINVQTATLNNLQWLFAMRSTAGDWSTAPATTIAFDDVYYSK